MVLVDERTSLAHTTTNHHHHHYDLNAPTDDDDDDEESYEIVLKRPRSHEISLA